MPDWAQAFGTPLEDISQRVERAKLDIRLPDIDFLTYFHTCLDPGGRAPFTVTRGGTLGQCSPEALDAAAKARAFLPKAAISSGVLSMFGLAWVESPPGSAQPFGVFPAVKVHTVAFGTIPVSAVVHLTQPVHDGQVDPLPLTWASPITYVPAGVVIPGYGPSQGYPYNFSFPVDSHGALDVRLSDVSVDGVPLEVGSHCSASSAVTLDPKPGYYSMDYAKSPPKEGEPGEWLPAGSTKSYLPGVVNVGQFSGCGVGAEDLDPLMTNLISGDGNKLSTTQSHEISGWCGWKDPKNSPHPPVGSTWCKVAQTPMPLAAVAPPGP